MTGLGRADGMGLVMSGTSGGKLERVRRAVVHRDKFETSQHNLEEKIRNKFVQNDCKTI